MYYILTYCSGYNYQIYQRFIGSLVDTSKNIAVIFFIKELDIDKLRKLQNEFSDISIRYVLSEYFQQTNNVHIQTYRFELYYKYLKTQVLNKDDYILLCDSRDVLFQKDVMEIEKFNNGNDLFVFEEDNTIKNNKHNSKWIDILNNHLEEDISYIKDNQIICSGTILGTLEGIMTYLRVFNDTIEKLDNSCLKYCGLDQGIHNYLIYFGKLDTLNIKKLSNIDNYINTLCLGYKGLNNENKIVNSNNEVSCMVHQYDRLPIKLLKKISTKYDFVIKN